MALNGTVVTASTSVVLVDTSSGLNPYIVYFPYVGSIGRYITVRDNSGYASTGNSVIISTLPGAYFPDNRNTILINQPYGFITFSVQADGHYSVLNTFAFPTGSDSAYVNNINTNNIGIKDSTTNTFNYITASTGSLYLNASTIGNVTNVQLSNAINNVKTLFIDTINLSQVVREYVAVGTSITAPAGTIQTSSDLGSHWYNSPSGTQGFISSGTDIAHDALGYFIACGDNNDGLHTSNLGYIQWSFDGKTWYNSTSPLLGPSQQRTKLNYANGIWHALGSGQNGQSILWSVDRTNWNSSFSVALNPNVTYSGIAYSPTQNIWVACGKNTSYATSMLWSINGSNWNTTPSLPNIGTTNIYDIIYDGTNFIALLSNTSLAYNIIVSATGSNNWIPTRTNLNKNPGFLGGNSNICIALNESYSVYSLNNGSTWNNITGFPSGIPTRPYYDGSIWWVGINDATNTSYNVYTSPTGNNNWVSSIATNLFPSGYPNAIISINTSSNLNIQLISTVYSLQESFGVSSLQANSITLNTFTLDNMNSNVLNITSGNSNGVVYINIISTNTIQTNTLALANLNIDTLYTYNLTASMLRVNVMHASTNYTDMSYLSNIYTSTLYASDVINASILVVDTISSMDVYISSLNVIYDTAQNIDVSTINVSDLLNVSSNANIKNLTVQNNATMNIAYLDTVSTNIAVTSTIQFIDTQTNRLNELYSRYDKLTFNGVSIQTTQANPLYFSYELLDNTTGTPPDLQKFSILSSDGNMNNITSINISVQDIGGTLLGGFFSKVGVYTILHLMNPRTLSDHIFRIDAINESVDTTTYLFSVTLLSGRQEPSEINQPYNFFIESIGIPPPITPPANTATISAPIVAGVFNFNATNAFTNIPSNIGTYIPGGTSFGINLNNNNYSITTIPAIVGSIVYNTNAGFVVANVKCGSISATNGAYITIDSGVQTITVSGLTINNFPQAANNINTGYSIYITLQFLN